MTRTHHNLILIASFSLLGAACGTELSSPTAALRGASTADEWQKREVYLCKFGPVGTTATFEVTASSGTVNTATLVLAAKENPLPTDCPAVWSGFGDSEGAEVVASVTITEVSSTPGTYLSRILAHSLIDGIIEVLPPANSITVHASQLRGATVSFKNLGTPITGGGQGCTPGYWKQKQHFDSWTAPYTPATMFGSVFADAFPGETLLQVMRTGGGGLAALGRHTVAALLNTASGDVDYGMTTAQVIAAFNAAYTSGDFEEQKDLFALRNEAGCSLN